MALKFSVLAPAAARADRCVTLDTDDAVETLLATVYTQTDFRVCPPGQQLLPGHIVAGNTLAFQDVVFCGDLPTTVQIDVVLDQQIVLQALLQISLPLWMGHIEVDLTLLRITFSLDVCSGGGDPSIGSFSMTASLLPILALPPFTGADLGAFSCL